MVAHSDRVPFSRGYDHGSNPVLSDAAWPPHRYAPDPHTSPGAIAESQRQAVLDAHYRLQTADAAVLSAETCLPAWTVARRLAEMGLGAAVPKIAATPRRVVRVRQATSRRERVRAYLAGGPKTVREIAAGLGLSRPAVSWVLAKYAGDFVGVGRVWSKGRRYGLKRGT